MGRQISSKMTLMIVHDQYWGQSFLTCTAFIFIETAYFTFKWLFCLSFLPRAIVIIFRYALTKEKFDYFLCEGRKTKMLNPVKLFKDNKQNLFVP